MARPIRCLYDTAGQPMEGQNVDAHHLCVADFPGLETGPGDLHGDLGMGQSLPFSASEINLAAMVRIPFKPWLQHFHVGFLALEAVGGTVCSLPFSAQLHKCHKFLSQGHWLQIGSPGRGSFGGASDAVDLSGLPRNFSLSDLALDPVGDPLMHHDASHDLPHDFSLSDVPALDLDSGGER